jgi:hypothetical protein
VPATAATTVPTVFVFNNDEVIPVTARFAVEKLVVVAEVPVAVLKTKF